MKTASKSGFTMVEVIAVLLIIGVMSAVAIGFMSSTDYATEAGAAEQLRMDLRYAQQRAMGSLTDVEVTVSAGSDSYELSDGMVFGNGENQVSMESNLKSGSSITFTAQTGLPDADKTYTIGESAKVTVDGTTGFIE